METKVVNLEKGKRYLVRMRNRDYTIAEFLYYRDYPKTIYRFGRPVKDSSYRVYYFKNLVTGREIICRSTRSIKMPITENIYSPYDALFVYRIRGITYRFRIED